MPTDVTKLQTKYQVDSVSVTMRTLSIFVSNNICDRKVGHVIEIYANLRYSVLNKGASRPLLLTTLITLCYWLNRFPQEHNWLENLEKPACNMQLKLMTFLNGIKQQYLKIYQHEIKVNPQGTHH